MNRKIQGRIRRRKRTRANIKRLAVERLCVHRTSQHIYAQVISPCGSKVLASASSLDQAIKSNQANGGNVKAAEMVGALLAERAKAAGIQSVAFDRSGYQYHGRIKALADAAREGGMAF